MLSELVQLLDWVEVYENSANMSTSLIESDSPLWYLDKTYDEISNICSTMAHKYLEFETKSHVRNVFRDFTRKEKVPSTAFYLMYKVEKNRGLIEHQDVDSTF